MPHTRHGEPFALGSDASYEAALQARRFVHEQGLLVYRWLKARGVVGATQKEVAAALGIGRPSLCARFKALEDVRAIRKTAARRGGCQVYVATEGARTEQLTLLDR